MRVIPIQPISTAFIPSAHKLQQPEHMELIIKPTEACNFACTFCSSTNITEDKALTLDLDKIYRFLERYPLTGTIIVNGGDPLMVKPDYYWKIIDHLDRNRLPATLSLTSNLWAFHKKPDMWADLFTHRRVGVSTSFHYGTSRLVTKNQVFTESLFLDVSDHFLDRVGYRPDFISVITDENEQYAVENVRLAQLLDVECKLNYAMASGVQSKPYQLSKIYQLYIEVYNQGLWQWEYNTKQMMGRLRGKSSSCPQNRTCDTGIRCLQPSGDYYSCGSFGDDRKYAIDFDHEMKHEQVLPLQMSPELLALKDECLTCPMFDICNGCRKTIHDLKSHQMVDQHCTLMKTLAPSIIAINDDNRNASINLQPKPLT